MQVKDRMTPNPTTATEDTTFEEALHMMKEKKIRRLPIVNKSGRLSGIVVQKDLFSASPSTATSLSVFEVHYLLSKVKMKDVMTKRVVTVGDDCPLEEAARIMVDYKIGCLPITKDGKLLGIITETDIFKTFVEIMGGRAKGLRLTLDVTERKGELAAIANEIAKLNGNIVTLATFSGKNASDRIITVKVTDAPKEALLKDLEANGVKVLNAIDMTEGGYTPTIIKSQSRPYSEV
ncbi:MAG: CBS and ACT domain-containing protein [Deltaproteobacteria bacterium]|nr:CBS and ACT domain-containing protein [Deltaproteobacteria bacterium]